MPDYVIVTPELGVGLQPAGLSSAGVGVPATIEPLGEPSSGARYLNPKTRDYEINPATAQLAQMPGTRQRVLLAMLTIRGSATAVPGFGVSYPSKIGKSFEAEMRNSVRQALRHLTLEDAPVIRIDSIVIQRSVPGRAATTLSYTDLESGDPDEVTI